MKKIIALFSLILIIATVGAALIAWHKINAVEEVYLQTHGSIEFELGKGRSLYFVVEQLREYAEIDRLGFKLWLRLHPEFEKIQSGVYEIPENSRLVDVLGLLVNGQVKQMSVTLIEGLTISQWLETLAQTEGLLHNIEDVGSLYEQLAIEEFEFCANDHASIEGCLLPDTYFYTHGTSSVDILKRALLAMQTFVNEQWPTRFVDIPLNNKYEALILASIIEKETAIESERTEIAGVFVNRLNSNMRLQTDPTVIYGIGESFDGNITRKHLRTLTPYNTYVIKGLPITPIAMPNRASIQAALAPALTDSLYFVATGNGGHQFSTNLDDHNKAVRQYLQQRTINNSVKTNEKVKQ